MELPSLIVRLMDQHKMMSGEQKGMGVPVAGIDVWYMYLDV